MMKFLLMFLFSTLSVLSLVAILGSIWFSTAFDGYSFINELETAMTSIEFYVALLVPIALAVLAFCCEKYLK